MKDWLKNAVFYEIYPQTFNDTNGDGIGDFNGIIEKLDYIKDMGFTAIWMNPCFASPFSDAGYDVEDFYSVAPRYGTNDDLKRLFDEVHKRDMHIVLDLVAGHTAITHKWFEESKKAEHNEYSDRYIWSDNGLGFDDVTFPGLKSYISAVSNRDGICFTNFLSTQPALNYGFANVTRPWQSRVDSPEALATRAELINIIRFWLDMGCDGFRVDMAASLVKDDDGHKETIKLWQELFPMVHADYPDAVFISEWGEPEKSLIAGFDMDFLLHLGPSHYLDLFRTDNPYFNAEGKGDLFEFFRLYLENYNKTKGKGFICIPSGNHDMVRMAYKLDDTQLRLGFAFLLSMPGVPFIYNGDEIGMRYIEGLTSVEGAYFRTGARTPMQWDDTENAGFSSATADKLYISIDPSPDRPTVKAQIADEDSLLNEVKKLISIRKSTPALQEGGEFEPICVGGYPMVYKRNYDGKTVVVAINPESNEHSVNLLAEGRIIYSYNGEAHMDGNNLIIPPCSATFIELN